MMTRKLSAGLEIGKEEGSIHPYMQDAREGLHITVITYRDKIWIASDSLHSAYIEQVQISKSKWDSIPCAHNNDLARCNPR
jgi:hypothetical protein